MTALGAPAHTGGRRRGSGHAPHAAAPKRASAGLIARDDLVRRLTSVPGGALALLVAPAGYGKSSLVTLWEAADSRPFAAARLTAADDDPDALTRSIARALAPLHEPVRAALASRRLSSSTLQRALAAAVRDPDVHCVLVLDDLHAISSDTALERITELVAGLGPRVTLALVSRAEPSLPVARLRTERRLVQLGVAELALTTGEVGRLATMLGLDLDERGTEQLTKRTEGWPAAIHLAGLGMRDSSQPLRTVARFGGDDRLVADYIRDEMLAELPEATLDFLVRSSILDRLSGPACDAVLGRRRSAELLRELSRSNVLVLPLDRTDSEYRLHPMLAETLRTQLRCDLDLERELHGRAATWNESNGDSGRAIGHAIEAGDLERAGRLLWNEAPSLLGYGHCATLTRHLRRFSREQLASSAPLALTAASANLAMGDRALVEHWTSTAARILEPHETGGSLEGGLLVMRAAVSDAGLQITIDDAARAYALADDSSPWRSVACLVEGSARHLTGERDTARMRLEEGARRGAALAPAIQVLCLGQLALLAIDDGQWDTAELLAARAHAQIERVELGDYPTAALAFAVSAAVHAHFGHVEACDGDMRQAGRLLGQLAGFTPWFTAECRIALAWAAVRLSEQRTARRLLDEAGYELRMVPDAIVAHDWLASCAEQLDSVSGARSPDAEPLTKAELRVLQYLPTHLSFLEIAEDLFVSTNTVKTHARAVYRKLSASSRSEAVLHAREAGLLEAAA